MVETPTPPGAETQPVQSEPPSAIKTFAERLNAVEDLLAEARRIFEEMKEALAHELHA